MSEAVLGPKSAKYRVFCGYTWKTPVYLKNTLRPPGYRADFLNFASDFAPDQLSDSGKLASFQNGAPNTLCFPWKFPETQSAGDPRFSFLFSGKPYTGQTFSGVWYGTLAAQRMGGYGPDRPSPVSGRLGLSAGGGGWSRGGLREATIPYPAKSPNPGSCGAVMTATEVPKCFLPVWRLRFFLVVRKK